MKLDQIIQKLLTSPNIASRAPIYEKYDKNVQGNTAWERGKVAASICTPFMDFPELPADKAKTGVAIATGGNPNLAKICAKSAAIQAVYHAVWKLACVGAVPIGATDCLNFGNPEKKEQMGDFVAGVEGVKEACEALEVPIVSGNVSLYNESDRKAVPPSALVGIFGRVDDVGEVPKLAFENAGETIFLVGSRSGNLGGSALLEVLEAKDSRLPRINVDSAKKQIDVLRKLAAKNVISTAHPVGLGGMIIAICKACFLGGVGAKIKFDVDEKEVPGFLFGEDLGVVVSTSQPDDVREAFGGDIFEIGEVVEEFELDVEIGGEEVLSSELKELERGWGSGLRGVVL